MLERLKACICRAEKGEKLTIGFLGGSITQGCQASTLETSYAHLVWEWWKKSFPQADIQYVNAGIGGTGSLYGNARAVRHMLMYEPDLVIVDFAVNDCENPFCRECFEGLLRKLLSWKGYPAVLILNNVYYDSGRSVQEEYNWIAEYYKVPCVSIRDTVYQRMLRGDYSMEELTSDGLHPNDLGHRLLADELIRYLEGVRRSCEAFDEIQSPLPEPVTENAYEQAALRNLENIRPECCGFRADVSEKTGHLDVFKNGWIGKEKGDRIVFFVEASCIAVQYRKTVRSAGVKAELALKKPDGSSDTFLLDAGFDEDWDCLYLLPVLHHGVFGLYRVEIRLLSEGKAEAEPFYLHSLITA